MNSTKTNKKRILTYLIIIILAAGLFFIFHKPKDEVSYLTDTVRRQNIEKVVNATGEVRAISLVTVGAQASGIIEKLHITMGQHVNQGDLIAEIDSTTQQNDVNIYKARLKSYEAQLAAAKVSLNVAKKQYNRLSSLIKARATSQEDLENAQNTYEAAKSRVTEIETSLAEVKISLSTAETNLGYTRITAPLDGTIVSIPVKQGQTVNAAMSTPTIVQIADLSQMEILIEISEGDILNIKPGVRVTYSILADPGTKHETILKSIDPGLTLLTNAEYTEVVGSSEAIYYYGRLIVPNDNNRLRIGMTTQNVIYVESAENVLTVPSTSIKGNGDNKYVNILTDKGIKQKQISTGVTDGINVEVKNGLSENDTVIIAYMSSKEITTKAATARIPRGL